jgi:putative ABC transport system permease protein
MGVIRYKIWRDLWQNKGRTLQVVLIIGMGAFAIGMIIGSRNLMQQGMTALWQSSLPAMINLTANPAVDDETIRSLEGLHGVQNVEGYLETTVEWRLSPTDEWQPAGLIARADYEDQEFAVLQLISGQWPKEKSLAVEHGAEAAFGIPQGGSVDLKIDDKIYAVPIEGQLYNPTAQPPGFGGNAQFYAGRDRFGELTGDRNFNRILAGAAVYDEAALTDLADRMQRRLEKLDIESGEFFPGRVSDPNKHFFQDFLDGIFLVLGIMAALALILGLFLVYNTINAVVIQQINQIGVMKAIGAGTGQILGTYLVMVVSYGLLALLIAVPLGAVGAYFLNNFLLAAFNAQPQSFGLSPMAVAAQVVIALFSPLLASLVPVFTGARITVREAISTYGLNAKVGRLTRWLTGLQTAPRLLLLTLNNTFRHRGRVVLTQITLVGSGLIFMMVMSARDSVQYSFGDLLFSILRFNVSLGFEEPVRIDHVEQLTLAQPQVKAVEMWAFGGGSIRLQGQPEANDDEGVFMFGVPVPTTLYGPQLRAGRWLKPDDTYAVVLNQKVAADAGVTVGDWITVKQNLYGESQWQVVGLIFDPIITESAHVPRDMLLKETRSVGKAGTVWIQTHRTDALGEEEVATALRRYYDERNLEVSPQSPFGRDTASQITDQILNNFGIFLSLFAVMAIIIGLVGSIALSGVLSLNVLERRREIGVMRATGAVSRTIAGLFIGEGLILGLLSWVIALPLSVPAGYVMVKALAAAIQGEIVYRYTPTGALYWLGIITVLSVAASWLPARSATRISVRDSLAYS